MSKDIKLSSMIICLYPQSNLILLVISSKPRYNCQYSAWQKTGCSLTVECAAGGRVAGVQLSAPRLTSSYLSNTSSTSHTYKNSLFFVLYQET